MEKNLFSYFLESKRKILKILKESRKVYIIADYDIDGFCSAYLMNAILKKMRKEIIINFPLGKGGYQEKISKNIGYFNKSNASLLIILDLNAKEIKTEKKVIVIDHHVCNLKSKKNIIVINPRKINKNVYMPTSCILFHLFKEFFDENLIIFSALGTVGDYGFACKELIIALKKYFPKFSKKNWKKSKLFEYIKTLNAFLTFKRNRKTLVKTIKRLKNFKQILQFKKYRIKIEKEIEKELKFFKKSKIKIEKGCYFYLKRSKLPIRSLIATVISERMRKNIIIVGEKISEEKCVFSIRRGRNLRINLLKFLQKMKERGIVESYGGHPEAAGGVLLLKKLNLK